jgi:flavorubredoxin
MDTTVHEIADGIYRISTFLPAANLPFNQYLILAEEPMLFHAGHRQLFGQVSEAVARVIPLGRLRWLTFGHVEADECGAMNRWLQAAPDCQVVHGATGVLVSLNDLADRPPRMIADREAIDLGGKSIRWINTPHLPHGWDAGLICEESTSTLFAGDLFTAQGPTAASTDADIVSPAIDAENTFHFTAITPSTGPVIRTLADLDPSALALMHGPAFTGAAPEALRSLADYYDGLLRQQLTERDDQTWIT